MKKVKWYFNCQFAFIMLFLHMLILIPEDIPMAFLVMPVAFLLGLPVTKFWGYRRNMRVEKIEKKSYLKVGLFALLFTAGFLALFLGNKYLLKKLPASGDDYWIGCYYFFCMHSALLLKKVKVKFIEENE